MRKLRGNLLIGSIVFIMLLLAGCGAINKTNPAYDVHAIEKIQEKVPFTVVVPTYFPEGIIPYPAVISEPGRGRITDNSVMIYLTYKQPGSISSITISEENAEATWQLATDSSIYLDISGVKVLEEEAIPTGINKPQNGLEYGWNNNGVNFSVVIYGFSKDECRKVIESMIKEKPG